MKSRNSIIGLVTIVLLLTSCVGDMPQILPILNTIAAVDADIASTTATLKGEITYLGNAKIIEYGIELSANQLFSPNTTSSLTTPDPSVGQYQVSFSGLTPNTLYYYHAYVLINTARVYSQNALHFTTKP